MGVLPVECPTLDPAGLTPDDRFDLLGVGTGTPEVEVHVIRDGRIVQRHEGRERLDNEIETAWSDHGGLVGHLLSGLRTAQAARRS
jgi:aconitate hydratase